MQRKPGFPIANCSIKMPEGAPTAGPAAAGSAPDLEEESELRRQQLINFGHSQWGFNNWSWMVTKQDLDFVDVCSGKHSVGVVAFVTVIVKSLDIQRQNIGYATSVANQKGSAIFRARKSAVTNALRETLLGFGGSVATELMELLQNNKSENQSEPLPENNQNLLNKEPKNAPLTRRDSSESGGGGGDKRPPPAVKNLPPVAVAVAPQRPAPPAAAAAPRPCGAPPAPRAPPLPRPPSNQTPQQEAAAEEARAERKRRQRQAQEEFRKQMHLQGTKSDQEVKQESRNSSGFDTLLLEIPTQEHDIHVEGSGDVAGERGAGEGGGKRKSPVSDGGAKRRNITKLDIVTN